MSVSSVNHTMYQAFTGIFSEGISASHHRRLEGYRNYWKFYLGNHWSYTADQGENQLSFNYSRRIVDLHTNFTFKKGFKVVIPDDPTTTPNESEDREFQRILLEETWRKNRKELWCIEAGQSGGVSGDVFARVSWDDQNPLEDPYARVDILPSHYCFPDFGGPAAVDRKKLSRIFILIPQYKKKQAKRTPAAFFNSTIGKGGDESTLQLYFQIEEFTATKYETDIYGNLVLTEDENGVQGPTVLEPAMHRLWDEGKLVWEKVNPLGEIPVVHIPNYPLTGEYYGISDLVDATCLNRELNEKATDISDIIQYHGSPTTVVTGAKMKDLEKGMNRMWSLPEGAKVENLTLEGDLKAANAHYAELKNTMLEITSTPEQAFGNTKGISNTPGVTLNLQYMPMIEKRDVKVQSYGSGIRLVNRLILKFNEYIYPEFSIKMNSLVGNKYRNDVVFPDPMPHDEAKALELAGRRLDLGLSHKAKELEVMGYSQAEIINIIQGAIEDAQREAEAMLEYGGDSPFDTGPGSGNFQPNRGGSDETRGDKISNTSAKESE